MAAKRLNRRNQQNAGDEQMAGSMANAQREFKDFLSDFNTMDANNEIVVDLAQNLDSVEAKDGDAQSFASGVSTSSKEAKQAEIYHGLHHQRGNRNYSAGEKAVK